MANPAVQLPDSVFGLLDVLAVAIVIALTRRRGTASGRVAALLAGGDHLLGEAAQADTPGVIPQFSFRTNRVLAAGRSPPPA
jgi:hypothetical protein